LSIDDHGWIRLRHLSRRLESATPAAFPPEDAAGARSGTTTPVARQELPPMSREKQASGIGDSCS
jgi:hypothetical protein